MFQAWTGHFEVGQRPITSSREAPSSRTWMNLGQIGGIAPFGSFGNMMMQQLRTRFISQSTPPQTSQYSNRDCSSVAVDAN